ncbi:MAG: PIN domain nuclease [Myxococcales bacterium]|nr:PIN domain nuclease [Myxococcales bacterium]
MVDTSAWVDFFRGEKKAISRLDPLLAGGGAAICGPIYSEVLSGAPTRVQFDRLASSLRGLDWLEPRQDVWQAIAESRFALARLGNQAKLVDLYIAQCALAHGSPLLTRDRDFEAIARAVPMDLEVF